MSEKADLIWLLRLRRYSDLTTSMLWGKTIDVLKQVVGDCTEDETAALLQQHVLRERELRDVNGHKYTITELKDKCRHNKIAFVGNITLSGLADLLSSKEGETTPSEPFVPDVDQSRAIALSLTLSSSAPSQLADVRTRLLILSAGPGAGKTSTVCSIMAQLSAQNPDARIVALVYNTNAETTLKNRLRILGVRPMANKHACSDTPGCAVLTFDKYAYQINKNCERISAAARAQDHGAEAADAMLGNAPLTEEEYIAAHRRMCEEARARRERMRWDHEADEYTFDYKRAFEHATQSREPIRWDYVVVDEAQDVLEHHRLLIETTLENSARWYCSVGRNAEWVPNLVAAGDPRQEIWTGATWFSHLYAHNAPHRVDLRYNHRSSTKIVSALNTFGRFAFPTIHHDQIATRAESGIVRVHNIECRDDWRFNSEPSAQKVGWLVGELLTQCDTEEIYAVTPVSTASFGLEAASAAFRESVQNAKPGFLAIDASVDGVREKTYTLATSKKIKGTERSRVVVVGADVDYDFIIGWPEIAKLLYVALSRARDELHIILRPLAKQNIARLMDPLLRTLGEPLAARAPLRRESKAIRVINVKRGDNGDGSGQSSLCSVGDIRDPVLFPRSVGASETASNTPFIASDPPRCLVTPEGDADFVGLYVEALIAHALGAPLASLGNCAFDASKACEEKGLRYVDGCFVVHGIKKSELELHGLESTSAAYSHTLIRFSALCGRPWTVSARLAREDSALPAARSIAEWIRHTIKDNGYGEPTRFIHNEGMKTHLKMVRGGLTKDKIQSEFDISIDAGTSDSRRCIIELKHVQALSALHRHQAAIYATAAGVSHTLLVNTLMGKAEWVAAASPERVSCGARALLSIANGRRVALGDLLNRTVRPPADLYAPCVIVVDTETDGFNTIEIGAIAIDMTTWTIIATFNERAPGVREVTAEEQAVLDINAMRCKNGPPDMRRLSGLCWDEAPSGDSSDRLESIFREWVDQISTIRCFVHWGGTEHKLCGEGDKKIDALRLYRSWLGVANISRSGALTLSHALNQLVPEFEFTPHRAFEDACATAAVFCAMINTSGTI